MRILATTALAMISTASFAAAPVVTENLTGTIGGASTVDTQGYFGKAGTDLSGAAITIYLQYVPKLLGASQDCRTHACTYNTSAQAPDTPGSVLVTLTVNGQRLVYSASYESAAFFATQTPYALTLDVDAFSGFGLDLPGIQLYVPTTAAPLFGQPLLPASPPVLHKANDYVDFFNAANQTPVEELTFTVTKAAR